jgi:uncharacterized SAM-binding protein YcdF (DUF218 family)
MAWRRIVLVFAAMGLAAGVSLTVPAIRIPMLQRVAATLVVGESAVGTADIVVVAIDAGEEGLLEAADLVRKGVAARVAVLVVPDGPVEDELRRRGIPYPDLESLYRTQLEALGVRTIVESPRVTGTTDEAAVLPGWCAEHGYRSVLVVTSWHHSRRLQRALKRSTNGQPIRMTIRISRYSNFGPDNWWLTREGERTVVVELQKLAIDVARHPFN